LFPLQIITSLSLINPVPNLTVALSGAVPDPSTGKVTTQTARHHVACFAVYQLPLQTLSAQFCPVEAAYVLSCAITRMYMICGCSWCLFLCLPTLPTFRHTIQKTPAQF